MKSFLLLVVILSAALFMSSCSKSKDDDLIVKYEVVNSDAIVFSIDYTSAEGGLGYDDNPAANWTKEIHAKSRPFTAQLQVDFENGDNVAHHYTLNIRVNGEVKATQDFTIDAFEVRLGKISYVIE